MSSIRKQHLAICLATVSIVVIYLSAAQYIDCASTGLNTNRNGNNNNSNNNNSNGNNNRLLRPGNLLSNLFRRQVSSANKDADNAAASSNDSPASASTESDDPATQTEMDAQKFMDSLPGANSNNGPSSFRERVSESWGVLRDGVSNQFKSLRDNWSETVEDLRDTWTGNSD